jgi:hypothetical protein
MSTPAAERFQAWQCIGCGKIESPQPCIGVCRDRNAEFVDAVDYDRLAREAEILRSIALDLATITPREGAWERSYKALQMRAREALQRVDTLPPSGPRQG